MGTIKEEKLGVYRTNENGKEKRVRKNLLPLTSDYIFHAVFGRETKESKEALIALLNLILERENDPITEIIRLNPISIPTRIEEKSITMDIKVKTENGEKIDIEMQMQVTIVYKNRAVYYCAKMASEGLEKGKEYDKLSKTIVINILNEELFPETKRYHNVFTFREKNENFELTDVMSIHFLELSKIDTGKAVEELSDIEKLCAYIKYAADETMGGYVEELLRSGEGAILMTDHILQEVSKEDIARELYEAEMRKLSDDRTLMAAAVRKGVAEGMEKGMSEGMEKGMEKGIKAFVLDKLEDEIAEEKILAKLQKSFNLDAAKAKEYYDKYAMQEICND